MVDEECEIPLCVHALGTTELFEDVVMYLDYLAIVYDAIP